MNVHHYPGRAAAAIAAAVLLACTSTPAQAATFANAAASQTVSSGSWGAVASLSTAAPYGSGPLTLSFTNNGIPAHPSFTPKYFTIGNTGTIPIMQATYVGTTTAPSTVRFIIESCTSTWNETTGACPGGTVATILTTPTGTSTIPATSGPGPANSGTAIRLRARITFSGNVPKTPAPTLTIGITVDRTQVRTATTTSG